MALHWLDATTRKRLVRSLRAVPLFCALGLVVDLCLPDTARTAPASEPLAEVSGEAITAAEIEQALGAQVRRLEQQIYEMKRQRLEAGIGGRLLALQATGSRPAGPALARAGGEGEAGARDD